MIVYIMQTTPRWILVTAKNDHSYQRCHFFTAWPGKRTTDLGPQKLQKHSKVPDGTPLISQGRLAWAVSTWITDRHGMWLQYKSCPTRCLMRLRLRAAGMATVSKLVFCCTDYTSVIITNLDTLNMNMTIHLACICRWLSPLIGLHNFAGAIPLFCFSLSKC